MKHHDESALGDGDVLVIQHIATAGPELLVLVVNKGRQAKCDVEVTFA